MFGWTFCTDFWRIEPLEEELEVLWHSMCEIKILYDGMSIKLSVSWWQYHLSYFLLSMDICSIFRNPLMFAVGYCISLWLASLGCHGYWEQLTSESCFFDYSTKCAWHFFLQISTEQTQDRLNLLHGSSYYWHCCGKSHVYLRCTSVRLQNPWNIYGRKFCRQN